MPDSRRDEASLIEFDRNSEEEEEEVEESRVVWVSQKTMKKAISQRTGKHREKPRVEGLACFPI
jgi:hypothetical protein